MPCTYIPKKAQHVETCTMNPTSKATCGRDIFDAKWRCCKNSSMRYTVEAKTQS